MRYAESGVIHPHFLFEGMDTTLALCHGNAMMLLWVGVGRCAELVEEGWER